MSNKPLVTRYKDNPILTKHDVPYPVETVHNAGATKFEGRYILLFRSHLHNGRSILGIARSDDGYNFLVDSKPFMVPSTEGVFSQFEEYGVEDPRICSIDGVFYITYSAYSRFGVRIALARTRDFKSVERISLISEPDMRNVVIFPQTFDGRYARLDRPHSEVNPWSIWLSWSPDLVHWGESEPVINPVTYHWDQMKIGPGATPVRTSDGWLNLFHGVFPTMDGSVYRLGVALHDIANPATVLGVADDWIVSPEDSWELTGYVHNVVFSCGAVAEDDGTLKIYWGAADTVMCVGTARIADLVQLCRDKPRTAL
ncbi:MAG: glycoside hydrolase family 130 protein [Gammaproteobacteria bacterium]|nr:glycoside hydrolase family 130 protein [Gammaproteobacteria bacterium]MDH3465570.1 glycoside hydrolase family 130 protein [Gammaproteobacteria bacterium]